ncbi:MAG: hypothetical protein ABW026_16090 [Microvirga sp.]
MKHYHKPTRLTYAEAELVSFEDRAVPSCLMFFIGVASGLVVISAWLVSL